jgi:hypothetical protein
MGIHAIGAMRRAKLMIGGRILALAVQFTLARDATAQLETDQPVPQMDRQFESACALSACPATVAENTGNCGSDVCGDVWRRTMQHTWTSSRLTVHFRRSGSECGATSQAALQSVRNGR